MIKCTYLSCLKVVLWFVFAIFGLLLLMVYWADAYTDSCQTSEIELFLKIVSKLKILTFFSKKKKKKKKNSILDVWQGSEYASAE